MIKVCDAIMGSGKSSAAITYMNEHSDQKFIYITPYLDEATRIRKGCPKLRFAEPSDKIPSCGFTKTGHTLQLLKEGRNIATTHQAMKFYTKEIKDLVREQGYTLIIDEDVEILEKVKCHPGDIELLVRAGYVEQDGDNFVVIDESYSGTALMDIFRIMQSRTMTMAPVSQDDEGNSHCDEDDCVVDIAEGKKLVYWVFPASLITSFKDVFVLTYLFESQDIHHLFHLNGIEYQNVYVTRDVDGNYRFADNAVYMPPLAGCLAEYIHIIDHQKLNAIGEDRYALSSSWHRKNPEAADQLRKHIQNYFLNLTDSPANARMWSCYKKEKSNLSAKGYAKRHIAFNMKATNELRGCYVLAYPVNLFPNVGIKLFYRQYGIELSDDAYALSTMIQWIWRSAIRDGKEIYLYLPSSRMRTLLVNWMDDVKRQYDEWHARQTEGGEQVA